MADKEEWNEVDVPKEEEEKVQYEVEGEETKEVQASTEPEVKQKEPEVKEDVPEELEGIETKGAQKRIKQLIRQRKERDEQIQKLIQANETLQNKTTQQRNDFTKVSKLNLDASEKQIKDKLELARTAYKNAHEEGDSQKVLQAQESLNDAQTDLKNLNITR